MTFDALEVLFLGGHTIPGHTSSSIACVHFRGSNQKDKKWYGVEKKENDFFVPFSQQPSTCIIRSFYCY